MLSVQGWGNINPTPVLFNTGEKIREMNNGKIKYTSGVLKSIKQNVKKEIMQSATSDPQLRAEVRRVFQMANRRIQNIESKGLLSPAVSALGKGDIQGFAKFTMQGDWETLKIEYAKAIGFLRQPTSSAMGTRQYNNHLKKTYGLSDNEFDMMARSLNNRLSSLSESDFVERYLMRYKDFTGELEQSAQDVSGQIESDAQSIEKALENALETSATNATLEVEDSETESVQRIIDSFKDFGLFD